jgi:D-alanyl-D-alanine carboxypeptidase (penicillin-binding protein 5/6)
MTAYLALRTLPLHKRLVAAPYQPIPGESLLGLQPGERISVRDLLYGLLLPSGNDAAVTLADGVAGSVPAFVEKMNDTAKRLGLHDTSYANPIGLDDPSEYSSPRDLTKLTLRLRHDRVFRRIVNTPRTTLHTGAHPRTILNRNDLILRMPWMNGVKTGYTPDAGNVLVGSGTRRGVTLLSVVMGEPSEATRNDDTLGLMRYGFSLYRREIPVRQGQRVASASITNGEGELPLIAQRAVSGSVRRGEEADVVVQAPQTVAAPVIRGERVGRATVIVADRRLGRTPLLAAHSVTASSSGSAIARVDDTLPGPRAVVWAIAAGALAAIVIGIAAALPRRRRD